jgi:membrane protein
MADAVIGIRGGLNALAGEIRRFWPVFRRACVCAYENNTFGIAKGAAYSALLAFFPVLTTVTAILVQANAYAVAGALSRLVFQVVPPGTEEIVFQLFVQRGQQPVYLLFFATLLSIWAASGIMLSLMEGFRAAYGIRKGRPFLQQRGVAAVLVFSAAVPIVIASALLVFGSRAEAWILTSIGLLPRGAELRGSVLIVTEILRTLVSVAAIIAGTSLMYCLGPNPTRPLRSVLPGTFLAAFLWWVTTTAFAWYVRNIANYNVLYGSVGAVIALLVWMYLLSVIALIGCEYNAQRVAVTDPKKIR